MAHSPAPKPTHRYVRYLPILISAFITEEENGVKWKVMGSVQYTHFTPRQPPSPWR
jgi:hypothetical protein